MRKFKKEIFYVTDDEYRLAEERFYNNESNYTDHISWRPHGSKGGYGSYKDPRWLTKTLLEEEEYIEIPDNERVVFTSKYRLLNRYFNRQMVLHLSTKSLWTNVQNTHVDLTPYVVQYDKVFDYVKILKTYMSNNWFLRIASHVIRREYTNGKNSVGEKVYKGNKVS